MIRGPLVASLCVALLAGCAGRQRAHGPLADADAYPGQLRPASTVGADLVWRQSVDAIWPEGAQGFDAAVQLQGDTLLVLGLSPIGQPGFVLRLVGERIEVENRSGMELPIPARFVLLDVQRVFFPWLAPPAVDGEFSAELFGERVTERWSGGRLVERRFERLDAKPPGVIRVTCEWGRTDWIAPTRAVLDNGWYGYRLEVRTHEETRLPAHPEDTP